MVSFSATVIRVKWMMKSMLASFTTQVVVVQ
jgi:hypothetical protein